MSQLKRKDTFICTGNQCYLFSNKSYDSELIGSQDLSLSKALSFRAEYTEVMV